MKRVVYIAGYGRSGSTVLDVLLANAPGVFGAGEAERFFHDLDDGGVCTCEEPYSRCEIWRVVLGKLQAVVGDLEPGPELQRLARDLTAAESKGQPRSRSERERLASLSGEVWQTFFTSLFDLTGATHIVDSSKSSRTSVRRVERLTRDAGLDVRVIHLIRDPRAVAYSAGRRGNNDQLEAGSIRRSIGGALRPLVGWTLSNLAAETSARRLPDAPTLRVRYEDLMTDPEGVLRSIGSFIEVDVEPVLATLENGESMSPGHGVRGNRMRRGGPIRLKFDRDWVDDLDPTLRRLSYLTWPLARRYGYRVSDRGRATR